VAGSDPLDPGRPGGGGPQRRLPGDPGRDRPPRRRWYVVCLNLAFSQILADPNAIGAAGRQDFIFATGLFDYLRESRARELIAGLSRLLNPGGLLAIGNAIGPNEHFWSAEFVLDWTLLYRTRDEMLRLAADVPGEPVVEVVEEPGKAYYFLLVRQR
jgi:SAM-dependent methyltransferase